MTPTRFFVLLLLAFGAAIFVVGCGGGKTPPAANPPQQAQGGPATVITCIPDTLTVQAVAHQVVATATWAKGTACTTTASVVYVSRPDTPGIKQMWTALLKFGPVKFVRTASDTVGQVMQMR